MKITSISKVFLLALMVAWASVSCYVIKSIEQDHEVVTNDYFHGKITLGCDQASTQGISMNVYGLIGICVPDDWTPDGEWTMVQVPGENIANSIGEEEYHQTIERKLVPSEAYTKLLSDNYPKPGYKWFGFITESNFISVFNQEDETAEIQEIYCEYSFKTGEKTGDYYIDYICGSVETKSVDGLGIDPDDTWRTRTASFEDGAFTKTWSGDTHVRVARPDGSVDEGNTSAGVDVDSSWNLVPLAGSRPGMPVQAFKDKKYDQLFTRTRGWNGGDGGFTVALPDGNVFWTFNDSFYGVVGQNRIRPAKQSFPRNSIMVQTCDAEGNPGETANDQVWLADYVQISDKDASGFYNARTHLRHPLGEKTEQEIADGKIDQNYLYWSGDGTIVDGKLQMLWFGVDNRNGDMINIGTALATYSLDGNMPEGYYRQGLRDYLPQEGNYLHLESVDHNLNNNPVSYGSTLLEGEDGHIYLYAQSGYTTVCARTETMDLSSKWSYYVKKADGEWVWQDEYPTAAEIQASAIAPGSSLNLPWVIKEGDWYYLISQGSYFSRKMYILRSKNPYGPFEDQRELCTLPGEIEKIGDTAYHWLYMVNLHQELSREGELVFTTNTDADDFSKNFNKPGSADYYRLFFYRVFGWQSLFPQDKPAEPVVLAGDANGDGAVSVADLTLIASYILAGQGDINAKAADINGDGIISVADLTMVANKILTGK